MSLTARILCGFVLLALAGVVFLLRPILDRVERQSLEAVEEPMVDAAEMLAGIVSHEMERTGTLPSAFAPGLAAAAARKLDARIFVLKKDRVSMDVYVTDARGVVVFDSGRPARVGADLSMFNDVRRTLSGSYGARSTRDDEYDEGSSIMYVGAPLIVDGRIVGVLSVYKPQQAMRAFILESRRQIFAIVLGSIAVFLFVGLLLSRWVTEPIARLTRYAEAVTRGERPPTPRMPGRQLRVLGESVERMRDALEDRNYVAGYVQTLSHEMKAPVAAIQGAAELLDENLPPERRARFLANIRTEASRLHHLIEQLLALAALETRKRLDNPQPVDFAALVRRVAAEFRERGVPVETSLPAESLVVRGDEFLLATAVRNLVQNAADFSPRGAPISLTLTAKPERVVLAVRDRGAGLPDYAADKVFDRFYSLPRPATGRKSSGLGLCFVREAASLHGGRATLANRSDGPGAEAWLEFPRR